MPHHEPPIQTYSRLKVAHIFPRAHDDEVGRLFSYDSTFLSHNTTISGFAKATQARSPTPQTLLVWVVGQRLTLCRTQLRCDAIYTMHGTIMNLE